MENNKWEKVDAIARKQEQALSPGVSEPPLAPINDQIETIRNQELDIIGRIKRNTINRKAALEKLRSLHDAQLEAAKHALRRAVDVDKERVDVVANKYIFQLNEQFLKDMQELGLQNFDARMKALLKLNETMAKLLKQAEGQDVPPSVRDATIENILKKYREFADRLMQEEIRLGK